MLELPIIFSTVVIFAISQNLYARCVSLPNSGGYVSIRLLGAKDLSHAAANPQCSIDIEMLDDTGGWPKKGERLSFWSYDAKICKAKPGSKVKVQLFQDCCDAIYDWCTVNAGRRISNAKGNPTF